MRLFSLTYTSSTTHDLSQDELLVILQSSKKNNLDKGITGILLYKERSFMQALEGPEENVRRLFRKIRQDPRHFGVMILGEEYITERLFAEWSMGFYNVDQLSLHEREAISPFLKESFDAEVFRNNPNQVSIMLLTFKDFSR